MKLVPKILLLIFALSIANSAKTQERDKESVLASIGNISKWNNVKYLLFTSTSANPIFKTRSYLIDKSSGRVRFDGTTNEKVNTTLLFNYKTKTLDKSYINGKLANANTTALYQNILEQLFEDTKLLFLPMFIISSPNNITISAGKIINSQKLTEVSFKNIYNLNQQIIGGSSYLNSKGDIMQYIIDQSAIAVSETKDIGDGILLPTRFISKKFNIKFNTVAAFTDIETDKFTNL